MCPNWLPNSAAVLMPTWRSLATVSSPPPARRNICSSGPLSLFGAHGLVDQGLDEVFLLLGEDLTGRRRSVLGHMRLDILAVEQRHLFVVGSGVGRGTADRLVWSWHFDPPWVATPLGSPLVYAEM